METHVNYTVAGTFVIILVSFIVFGIIWLSAGFSREKYCHYTVYMTESVSGLNKDAPVEFNGVNVGTVSEMKISHQNPRLVILTLKIKQDTPVTLGTKAKLGVRALTGVAYMLLEDNGANMQPLRTKVEGEYPVIPTTPSILVRLDTTLTQLNDSFRQVSSSIRSLLSDANLKWIRQLLENSNATLQLLEKKTIPATNQAIANIDNLTTDLSSTSADIKQNPSILIRGKAPHKLGPGEK